MSPAIFIAQHELKARAKTYLESDSAWEHGYYFERGYYGIGQTVMVTVVARNPVPESVSGRKGV